MIWSYPNSDIVTSPHAFVYLSNFRTAESRAKQVSDGHLYRYNLALNNLSSSSQIGPIKVEPKILRIVDATGAEYTGDMARVNDNLKGKKVQYSYCMTGFAGPKDWSEWAIVKRNHFAAESGATPSAQVWREYGCYPAEPVFVKDPMNSREDGGCLLSEVSRKGICKCPNRLKRVILCRALCISGFLRYLKLLLPTEDDMLLYMADFTLV